MTTRDHIMNVISAAILAATVTFLVCGCATGQPKVQNVTMGNGVQCSVVDSWPSYWSDVSGAVCTLDGKVVATFQGQGATPLTLFMNSPMNYGLGTLLINRP